MQKQRVVGVAGSQPSAARPPSEIVRHNLLGDLAISSVAPVRMLCAPHGGGKTTALRQFASVNRRTGMASIPPNAGRVAVLACLAALAEYDLIIVDQADAAMSAGREALFDSIDVGIALGKRYLLAGTSRTLMRAQTSVAHGIAEIIEPGMLAFSAAEIGDLAACYGLAADEIDVEQLKYDTDGWPLAVSWIVRDAARNGQTLRGAFDRWREHNEHLLLEFVTASHDDPISAEAFVAAIRSLPNPSSQRMLELLEAGGWPIVRMRTRLRPYRILTRFADKIPLPERSEPLERHLNLNLFGRFSCRVADQDVAFDRRRDQNLLTYVALAPGATVHRAELLATFWPNAPRTVASQGLRSTLYRLRRAIAEAAGCNADRYVSVGDSITLDLKWVSIDARTFREHVELAVTEDGIGNRDAAREHYLQAEGLYLGSLLASEALEPQLEPSAVEFGELFKSVRAHLTGAICPLPELSSKPARDGPPPGDRPR